MNKIIRPSYKKLTRRINVIGITLILILIIFSFYFRKYETIVFFLAALSFLVFVLILSYKIRYYPQIIILSENNISVEYLSKGPFRKKSFYSNIEDLSFEKKDKSFIICKNNKKEDVIVIALNTINEEDEKELMNLLI